MSLKKAAKTWFGSVRAEKRKKCFSSTYVVTFRQPIGDKKRATQSPLIASDRTIRPNSYQSEQEASALCARLNAGDASATGCYLVRNELSGEWVAAGSIAGRFAVQKYIIA